MIDKELAEAILRGAHASKTDLRSALDLTDAQFAALKAAAGEEWSPEGETVQDRIQRQMDTQAFTLRQRTVRYALAQHEAFVDEDPDDPPSVFAKETGRFEKFMIAGNGPTAHVLALFDAEGDLDDVILTFSESAGSAAYLYPEWRGEELYAALREKRV